MIPRTASSAARSPTPVHSAHLGQEVEVFYRWHALYGRRLRRQYSERRATGELVHVEVAPGVVLAVAGWMLDPVKCAAMLLGPPRVSVEALCELHRLLVEHGHRRSSVSVQRTAEGAAHEDHSQSTAPRTEAATGCTSKAAVHEVRDDIAPGDHGTATGSGHTGTDRRVAAGRGRSRQGGR